MFGRLIASLECYEEIHGSTPDQFQRHQSPGMMEVLGLDGGGTKTIAVVAAPDASIVQVVRGGGINPFDGEAWVGRFSELIGQIRRPLAAVALGLPGYGEDVRLTAMQNAQVMDRLNGPTATVNDVELACFGAFAGGAGILLLAGTGSMAWRYGADGQSARVGGWGSLFGDEGSAHWIGREALALLSKGLDRRADVPASDMTALLGLLGGAADDDPARVLLGWYATLTSPRQQVAQLAEGIDGLARRGHITARHLMDAAAEQLATHLRVLMAEQSLPWSYGGSVFRSVGVRGRLEDEFGPAAPPRLPPVGGGVLKAALSAGWAVDDMWIERLSGNLAAEGIV